MSSELCPHMERTPRGWLLLWGVWVYIHLRIHTPVNPRGPSTHVTLNSWLEAGSLGHGGRVTGRLPGIASCQGAPHPPPFRGTPRMPGFCTCMFGLCTEIESCSQGWQAGRLPSTCKEPRGSAWTSLSSRHLGFLLPSPLGRPACPFPVGPAQGLGEWPCSPSANPLGLLCLHRAA